MVHSNKTNNLIVAMVIAIIVLAMPLYLFRFTLLGIPTNVFEIVLYISLLIWLGYRLVQKNRINWRLPWAVWSWVAIGLVGAFVNSDWLSGLGYWRAYFFDGALIYLLIINEAGVAKSIVPRALLTVGGAVSIISLMCFRDWHVAADGRWLGWFGYDKFASPNYLSLFLTPITALAVVSMFIYRGWWRYIALISAITSVIALWGSQSRGAAVGVLGGVIIALIYYLCRNKKAYTWVYWSVLAVAIIAAATFAIAKPDTNASPADGRVATSNNIRWEIWKTSAEIIQSNPILGVGLGNYQEYFTNLTKDRVNYPEYISPLALTAHDLYLHIFASLGIVGLVIFLWWVGLSIKNLSVSINKKETVALAAAFTCILLYGLVDTPYFKNDLALLWWVIVALIALYGKEKSEA